MLAILTVIKSHMLTQSSSLQYSPRFCNVSGRANHAKVFLGRVESISVDTVGLFAASMAVLQLAPWVYIFTDISGNLARLSK